MQQLLGDKLGTTKANSFLGELFLQRLPANVRMVLASTDPSMDQEKPRDMAKIVMEVGILQCRCRISKSQVRNFGCSEVCGDVPWICGEV